MLDIRDLENIENKGRNLVFMLQETGYSKELGDKIEKWMDDVLYNSRVMAHSLYSSYENYPDYSQKTEDEANKSIYFRDNLSYLSMLIDDTISGCNKKNGTGYLYEGNCYVGDERASDIIERMNESSIDLIGYRCAYNVTRDSRYSLASLVNDMTACFHRLLEKYDMYIRSGHKDVIGRCIIEKGDANEYLVAACKEWDKTAKKFNENGAYESKDNEPLKARIIGNMAEFTVGSSENHRAHLDLDKGTLEYYDTDSDVNTIMLGLFLFSNKGLKCFIDEENGVFCSGLNKDNVPHAASTLAAATSMDYRMHDPDQTKYWKKFISESDWAKRCLKFQTVADKEYCLADSKIVEAAMFHPKILTGNE